MWSSCFNLSQESLGSLELIEIDRKIILKEYGNNRFKKQFKQ